MIKNNIRNVLLHLCFFFFLMISAGHLNAATIVIYPPDITYLQGYQLCLEDNNCKKQGTDISKECKDCKNILKLTKNEYNIIYSGLGKSVFESIHSGITGFNNDFEVKHKNLSFRADSYALPYFSYNERIAKFYQRIKHIEKYKDKLNTTMNNRNIDSIIWSGFSDKALVKIKECLNDSSKRKAYTELKIIFFNGQEIVSKTIKVVFNEEFCELSGGTLFRIKDQVIAYLKNQHGI